MAMRARHMTADLALTADVAHTEFRTRLGCFLDFGGTGSSLLHDSCIVHGRRWPRELCD